jgi:hypothetical protein
MLAQVTAVNQQIHELAPVLNSPSVPNGVKVVSSNTDVPVEAMLKRHNGETYLFAVCMRDGTTTADFQIAGLTGQAKAEVLGEGRTLELRDGTLRDEFRPWDVHLYRIRAN